MSHYFTEQNGDTSNPFTITVEVGYDVFKLRSDNGVFSKEHVDTATKLLIETTRLNGDEDVLDLGCGYGVVGISLLRRHEGVNATFTDTNPRAARLAQQNLERLGLEGDVHVGDAYKEIDGAFDVILSNPPMAAGRDKCYEFIEGAPTHLAENGRLLLVARHNKGGKALYKKMKSVFGNANTLEKSGGFRVYEAIR